MANKQSWLVVALIWIGALLAVVGSGYYINSTLNAVVHQNAPYNFTAPY